MDAIKEAFHRIKEDIVYLKDELLDLRKEVISLKEKNLQTKNTNLQTINMSSTNEPTNRPTQIIPLEPLRPSNLNTSIGNEGVPTNRPTNQQTDQQPDFYPESSFESVKPQLIDDFRKTKEILDSLDNLKKALRIKFKRLTGQEMLVFSRLYLFEENGQEEISYKLLATNLKLSESSIRDYINKLIKKGIPIIKNKLNNKKVALSISQDLKEIANLSTIKLLREL